MNVIFYSDHCFCILSNYMISMDLQIIIGNRLHLKQWIISWLSVCVVPVNQTTQRERWWFSVPNQKAQSILIN